MSGIGARLRRVENQVIVTEDQKLFERLKRFHFNLLQVSDKALIESLVSTFENKTPPAWVVNEFQEPIPHGSEKDRIDEAEAWAHETINATASSTITKSELASQLNAVLSYVQRFSLEGSTEYRSRLKQLMGEGWTCYLPDFEKHGVRIVALVGETDSRAGTCSS